MVCLQLAALLLAASGSLAAFESSVIPGAYIVEIDDTQDSAGLLSSIEDSGNVRMQFDSPLFKGVSVQLHDVDNAEETARRMFTSPAAKNMWPISLHSRPDATVQWTGNETASFRPSTAANQTAAPYSPHIMAQVDKLRAEGYTGKGIKVAVIDSGVDYNHPALGGCFGDGCLVSTGHDFVGDDYTGRNEPIPDPDPQDCDGHGSHVAGIIAAQNNTLGFTGAAPGATIAAYRVFGCYGSVTDDILIAAFTRAYEDGANMVSLSLGMPVGWSEHPWSVVVSRIVEQGVPVIVAAGNDGINGAFYASSPADGKGITAIAAIENTVTPLFVQMAKYAVDGEVSEFHYRKTWKVPEAGELPLWSPSLDANATDDGCEPFGDDTPDLSQRLVLFRAGGCTFGDKSINAANKGATAIALYSNAAGVPELPTDLYWNMSTNIFIDAETGAAWIDLLKAEKEVSVTIPGPDNQVSALIETENKQIGGAITHFSTWGPTWDMDVKPIFGAAGGNILSTFPLRKGGYAVLSGTSMATPFVAGIYALLGEVRGTLEPKLLQSLLASSANPQLFHDGDAYHDFLAPVAQQGAGAVQVYDAAFATTLLEPSSLSFNDTDSIAESLNFTLINEGSDDAVTYKVSYVSAPTVLTIDEALGVPAVFPNEMVEAAATLEFSESELTLNKGESATIDVIATQPDLDASRLPLWSGWITINGTDGTSLSLPYQGLAGSLRDAEVLGSKRAWITKFSVQGYLPLPDNSTFNLPPKGTEDLSTDGENVPLLITNYDLGTRLVLAELEALAGGNGTTAGETLGQHSNFPTRWQQRGRHIIDWGGRLAEGGYAPPGYYRFRVKALRLRGDENNDADWDVSLTQPFTITYQPGNGTETI